MKKVPGRLPFTPEVPLGCSADPLYVPKALRHTIHFPKDERSDAEKACDAFRLFAQYVRSFGLDDAIGMIIDDSGGKLPAVHDCETCAKGVRGLLGEELFNSEKTQSLQRILHGLRLKDPTP